jgi:hypothetical protein
MKVISLPALYCSECKILLDMMFTEDLKFIEVTHPTGKCEESDTKVNIAVKTLSREYSI